MPEVGPRQRARLRALAGHYLASELAPEPASETPGGSVVTPPRPRWILSARAEGVEVPWADELPREAAQRLGLPLLSLGREGRRRSRERSGAIAQPAAVVHLDLGPLSERDLNRLPDGGPGPDLLLWYADRLGGQCPRQLYLLACLASRLLPRQLLFLAPASPAPESEGRVADQTVESLRGLVEIETIRMEANALAPGRESEEGVRKLMVHLQALLRRKSVLACLLLFCLSLWLSLAVPVRAQESGRSGFSLVVEGLRDESPVVGGGQQFWSARNHTISVRDGMGTFSPDSSSFHLILPAQSVRLFEDGKDLPLKSAKGAIEAPLILLSPGINLRVAAGDYELSPDRLRIRIETGMSPLEQRRSYMIVLGIAFLIFALMWNTTRMRRKLDEPHISLRPKRKA